MHDFKKTDFYAKKPATLPRFVYRRLVQLLRSDPVNRQKAISGAIAELTSTSHPDFRKFKFFVPEFLRKALSTSELSHLEAETAPRRKHAARLKMVYPHVSDEFSLDADFLASVFDLTDGPEVKSDGRFFTVGSCFARNIATHLTNNGYNAATFEMAEDLNSPISNAFILDLVRRPATEQIELLAHWIRTIFPESGTPDVSKAVDRHMQLIGRMADQLRLADCVVLTLGNIVDFFKSDADPSKALLDKIFPKIVAMPPSEDIEVRSGAASRLKAKGAVLRLASYGETLEAIALCLQGIRALTQAPIVVTLSPVPIDSVIGLAESDLCSAIEVDCVSKSRLRSAFDECLPALPNGDAAIHYFPSFEIVRWVAPMLPFPSFGMDDAAARHVSSPILDAVCSLFLTRSIKWATGEARLPGQSAPEHETASRSLYQVGEKCNKP